MKDETTFDETKRSQLEDESQNQDKGQDKDISQLIGNDST